MTSPTFYRFYFKSAQPPCWSIDTGHPSSEICVQHIRLDDVVPTFVAHKDLIPAGWLSLPMEQVTMKINISGVAVFARKVNL